MSFFVRALYDFTSEESSGLSFGRGDVIEVLARLESGWWNGVCKENRGWFPSNYVELLSAEQARQYLLSHQQSQTPPAYAPSTEHNSPHQAQREVGSDPSVTVGDINGLVSTDHTLLAAAAHESVYRRGSIALTESPPGIASAVPSRLRMNRRASIPYNPDSEPPYTDTQPDTLEKGSSVSLSSHGELNTNSSYDKPGSAYESSAIQSSITNSSINSGDNPMPKIPQWESRMTLDGKTYYCNVFTDKTVWSINGSAISGEEKRSKTFDLIEDEVTLVHVALMASQQKDGTSAQTQGGTVITTQFRNQTHQRTSSYKSGRSSFDSQVIGNSGASISSNTTSYGKNVMTTWDQLSASISAAALNLSTSVGAGNKHEYLPLVLQVVAAVKRLLVSSSTSGLDQDSPVFRTHRILRDCHKEITHYICALTLSAKVASTVWPPPDALEAVQSDVAGLVRTVRKFVVEADNAGITLRSSSLLCNQSEMFPDIVMEPLRMRSHPVAQNSIEPVKDTNKRLSTLLRDEHTGATVLVKSSNEGAMGNNPEARQRLRQHLANHQRASPKGDHNVASLPSTSDILLQLDEGARELARIILMFDRYMRKIERFYADETQIDGGSGLDNVTISTSAPIPSPSNGRSRTSISGGLHSSDRRPSIGYMRNAADARLVAYAKNMVAALAIFLQVMDDLESYGGAIAEVASSDDIGSSASGPVSFVLSALEAARTSRRLVSENIGVLVATTQDFAENAYKASTADDTSSLETHGFEDLEINDICPSESNQPSHNDRVLQALTLINSSMQSLNHNIMSLHIAAKRVIEACDICDLRILWLRIAKYHVLPNTLASVPAGPTHDEGIAAVHAALFYTNKSEADPRANYSLRFRRSISLPQLRNQQSSSSGANSNAPPNMKQRLRAGTVDNADGTAHSRSNNRMENSQEGSNSSSTDDITGVPHIPSKAFREQRAKDKLNKFFGDDPSLYQHSKRPSQVGEISIPVQTPSPTSTTMVRTPIKGTASVNDDNPPTISGSYTIGHRAASTISSRASTAPSAKGTGSIISGGLLSTPQDQTPWYLNYDSSPDDILLTSDGQVKGSTLPALIERLAAHDVSDPNFVSTFLLTYHSFTTTPELFEGLFRRFLIQPPPGLLDHELADWTERKLKPVRLRIYNFFKTWLEQHYIEQMEGDPFGLELLREFACTTMAEHMSNAAEQLVRLIDKRRASQGGLRRMVPNLPHAAPSPILPRSLSRLRLMDINPIELARQFTLIDSTMFNKVRPIECLKTAWSKKPDDPKAFNGLTVEIAYNVKAMSTLSTQTTLWVTANILLEHEIKKRAGVIKYFITFAEHCRVLNNFNTLMSVLGALTSVPVERLTRTWQAVQQRSLATYNQLKQIMRTDRNFAEYRDALHSCNPPAIPFVGIYLQDLTFIEDGNDDMITNSHLINFAKRQRTAGTVRDLQQFQNVPYNLTPVAEIQDWLLKRLEELCPNGQSSDRLVEEFWKMSTTLEPKEKENERVLRLLQESGFL